LRWEAARIELEQKLFALKTQAIPDEIIGTQSDNLRFKLASRFERRIYESQKQPKTQRDHCDNSADCVIA
jgi:hypothetical protein